MGSKQQHQLTDQKPTIQNFHMNAGLSNSPPMTEKKRIVGGPLAGVNNDDLEGDSTDISKAGDMMSPKS